MDVGYEWEVTTAPTRKQLTGIESAGSTVVVSGRDGVLLERASRGDWTDLFLDGATGNGRGVFGAALTDDRERAWFCGSSGTFGYYDRERGVVESHAAPYDLTSDFRSLSVRGESGAETVHAVDDDGRIVRSRVDGAALTVEGVAIPGGGTSFTEIVDDGEYRYAADHDGDVFYTDDGVDWRRESLAETTIEGLALSSGGLSAVTDDGTVYRKFSVDRTGGRERFDLDVDSPGDIAASGGRVGVVGGDGQLAVVDEGREIAVTSVGTDETLHDVELLDRNTVVAVGADGVVAEGVAR